MPKKSVESDNADEQAADVSPFAATTVKMKRNQEQWPQAPHTAEVHVDEVDNWKKHGWEHAD